MSTRKELKDFVMTATFSGSNTIILTDVYKNVEIDQLKSYIIDDVVLDVASATASIDTLTTNMASATASIANLESNLSSATASIATLTTNLASATASIDLRIEKFIDNTETGDNFVQINDRCGTAIFNQDILAGSTQLFAINNTTLVRGDVILLSMEYEYSGSSDEPVILYHTVTNGKISILVKNIGASKVSKPIKIHFIKIN